MTIHERIKLISNIAIGIIIYFALIALPGII